MQNYKTWLSIYQLIHTPTSTCSHDFLEETLQEWETSFSRVSALILLVGFFLMMSGSRYRDKARSLDILSIVEVFQVRLTKKDLRVASDHPIIHFDLISRIGSQGQQSKQVNPDIHLPSNVS